MTTRSSDDGKPWWQSEIGTGGVLALTGLFLVALLPLCILPPLSLLLGWWFPVLFPTVIPAVAGIGFLWSLVETIRRKPKGAWMGMALAAATIPLWWMAGWYMGVTP